MPFCNIIAFGYDNELLFSGLIPDNYHSLLAVLLHTGRHNVTDGVMVRGT